MTTAARLGYGTVFQVADSAASPTAWNTIAEVRSITPPNLQVDQIDVTNMASPNRTREFIAGLTDPGEMSLELNYVPGSVSDEFILDWRADGGVRSCRIVHNVNTAVDTFDAFVLGYEPAIPADDAMTATLTLKVAGSVTRTP